MDLNRLFCVGSVDGCGFPVKFSVSFEILVTDQTQEGRLPGGETRVWEESELLDSVVFFSQEICVASPFRHGSLCFC